MRGEREAKPEDYVSVNLHVEGMTCSSCAAAIESALTAKPGIRSVNVSVLDYRAVIQFLPSMVCVRGKKASAGWGMVRVCCT